MLRYTTTHTQKRGYDHAIMNTELQTIELERMALEPASIFVKGGLDEILERIEEEARSVLPDVETAKGRKAIISNAARVARSKTYLDGLGKDLVAGLKKQTSAVDAERRAMRSRLDALKAEVREPLTQFEQKEIDRRAALEARMSACFDRKITGTIAEIEAIISEANSIEIDDSWKELKASAGMRKNDLVSRCIIARDEAIKAAEQVEAERARREAEEKARKEAEEKAIAERIERARIKAALQARKDAEKREAELIESEANAKREAKRIAVEQKAAEETRLRREKEYAEQQAKLEALRKRDEEERARKAEEHKRLVEAEYKDHRRKINNEILAAISDMEIMSDDAAKKLVVALAKDEIPHVEIKY